jgi:hypothetical protein
MVGSWGCTFTLWGRCSLHRRFDTNKDNSLSFDEFRRVAESAIDGDRKLPPPPAPPVPQPRHAIDDATRARLRDAQLAAQSNSVRTTLPSPSCRLPCRGVVWLVCTRFVRCCVWSCDAVVSLCLTV